MTLSGIRRLQKSATTRNELLSTQLEPMSRRYLMPSLAQDEDFSFPRSRIARGIPSHQRQQCQGMQSGRRDRARFRASPPSPLRRAHLRRAQAEPIRRRGVPRERRFLEVPTLLVVSRAYLKKKARLKASRFPTCLQSGERMRPPLTIISACTAQASTRSCAEYARQCMCKGTQHVQAWTTSSARDSRQAGPHGTDSE